MKKLFTLSFVLFAFIFFGKTQQLPIYTQYFWNDYALNPAFTGLSNYSPIQVGVRNQWTGFGGSPTTYTLGGHGAIKDKNMGIGGMVFLDDLGGAITQTGVLLNYSYQLKINEDSKLSFGLSGSLNQYSYDGTDIEAASQNDPSLYSNSKSLVPDFNFGVAYTLKNRLRVGLSANQILQSRIKKWNEMNLAIDADNRLIRHYFLTASYLAEVTDDIEVEPYTVLRSTFIAPTQFELGARVVYKHDFYAGFGYRYQDAIALMIGSTYNNFLFGYSYDITASKLRGYSSGTHEVVLGYRLQKSNKNSAKLK
jgi:type IX secretion system PorP/SprF family membrane protein